jgi:flagellar biosynthesis/type III secretory pathway protein FliH
VRWRWHRRTAPPSSGCTRTTRRSSRDLSSLTAGRSVALVADPDVARGGCVVEGAGRRIDAQIETALSRVAAVLR